MRIMYLLFSFTIGGTERLVSDICNEMVAQKHEVYLYIVNNVYSNEIINTLDPEIHIELQNRQVGGGRKIDTIFRITNYIRKYQIDVVHCNSLDTPELLILKPLYFGTTRIVHTIHDVGQYEKLPKWKIRLRNYLCDCLVAISECVKEDIIRFGADPNKTVTVYDAININKFQNNLHKEFNPEQVVIGNVARLMPEKKGQDILIKAVTEVKKKYPNIVCYFAGGYDEEHKEAFEKLQQMVGKLNLEDNVVFLGSVDNVPGLLERLDIFVLPSRFEGFGISLIEAMAMGIPCVASNLDGPAEIIGHDERGFLFSSGNAMELSDKLIQVIEHYKEIKDHQLQIAEYIRSKFSITEMCNRLISLYIGG